MNKCSEGLGAVPRRNVSHAEDDDRLCNKQWETSEGLVNAPQMDIICHHAIRK